MEVHEAFRNYFWNVGNPKGSFPTLMGNSSDIYDDRDDLVTLVRPPEEDRLYAFLRKHCSIFFLTRKGRRIIVIKGVPLHTSLHIVLQLSLERSTSSWLRRFSLGLF